MTSKNSSVFAIYVRNFLFGIEDSLVSTVGLLSGVAAGGASKPEIFLTGVVLIFVEAFSMGAGSYLSEDFTEEFSKQKKLTGGAVIGALVMFFSYFAAGFIPLSPYIVFETKTAFGISILLSLVALLVLGTLSAQIFGKNPLRHGIKMLFIGGVAIAVGIVVGNMLAIND